MKTFKEFILEAESQASEKFETMYDIEMFIQGKHSPDNFEETKDFLSKLNNLPKELQTKYEKGRFDTLIIKADNKKTRVDIDYPRRLVKLFYVNDDETQDTLYKQYSFQELIKV